MTLNQLTDLIKRRLYFYFGQDGVWDIYTKLDGENSHIIFILKDTHSMSELASVTRRYSLALGSNYYIEVLGCINNFQPTQEYYHILKNGDFLI